MFVPSLRFEEFKDEWDNNKLSSVASIFDGTHQTPKYQKNGVKFLSVENINNFSDTEKYVLKSDYEKHKAKPEYNDIFMTRIGSVGITNILKEDTEFSYYVSLALLKPQKINPDFLNQNMKTYNFQKEIWKRMIHVAFPQKINLGDIGKCSISYPNQKEQNKIALFLSLVDKRIELQENKINKLEEYKKGMMQKIFSQEIRFKDLKGEEYPEWEEKRMRKLFAKGKAGGTPKTTIKSYYNGDINFLSISDITSQNKYLYQTAKKVSQEGINNSSSWILPKDSLMYSMYASVGYPIISKIPVAISQAVFGMEFSSKYLTEYVYYYLLNKKDTHYIRKFIAMGTQGNLSGEIVKGLIVYIPKMEEIEKITKYLSRIDLILDKEKILAGKLNELKKGLLQQMFV